MCKSVQDQQAAANTHIGSGAASTDRIKASIPDVSLHICITCARVSCRGAELGMVSARVLLACFAF